MHPKNISIKDYQYELPDDRIAKFPLAERHNSQLLINSQGKFQTTSYKQLAEYLPENSLLVYNNTKVVEARILFQKPTGGVIELFCLEPDQIYPDITTAMLKKGKVRWKCLVGGAKKWKKKQLEKVLDSGIVLCAERIQQEQEAYIIELSWSDEQLSFAEILHLAGVIPLPPYLNRVAEESDAERYQTIYAKFDGSVAAPTAGLHFTDEVFASLKAKNISTEYVTLHVGAGTFKPVKAAMMDDHEMHAEFIDVSVDFIQQLIAQIKFQLNSQLEKKDIHQAEQPVAPIIPVGTTSMRTLESLFWLGLKIIQQPTIEFSELTIHQWDAYELASEGVSPIIALSSLVAWMQTNQMQHLITKTQIIIAPGYQFRICNALITNFHQPQSTLLLLVAALIGEDWKNLYAYALNNDFRFLSYGDGCLLWAKQDK